MAAHEGIIREFELNDGQSDIHHDDHRNSGKFKK
jgi:hypothetical protein